MNKQQTSLVFFCLFSSLTVTISDNGFPVSTPPHHNLKLFVFGDSYADTGNWPKSYGGSWQEPYGITFPGTPSGRFSNGRVLTDYIAGILGTKSPITYGGWKSGEKKSIKYGMNFAYGGTGVFNTLVNQPNMTTQINYFQQLVQQKQNLLLHSSSIAILSIAGNDYATYFTSNHTLKDLLGLTKSVISQLVSNVKRIRELGVRKIGITAMEPLGCLPQFTVSTSYQKCSDTENSIAEYHNRVLLESVRKLNNESDGKSLFVVLDLYKAFSTALNLRQNLSTGILGDDDNNWGLFTWSNRVSTNTDKSVDPGNTKLESLLKPCCQGVSKEYSCGNIETSTKIMKYSVCRDPNGSFFWDMIHPSQQGWHAVSSILRSSLLQLL